MSAIGADQVREALRRAADTLDREADTLTELDRAMGDGDLGVTAEKMAAALRAHADQDVGGDLGKYLATGGMALNRAAPSTFGTLAATALMRAGKEVSGEAELTPARLAAMVSAAEAGVRDRGKAELGDKTVLDALHPAAEAFAREVAAGADARAAGRAMLTAAEQGMDAVTAARSRQGRAGWIGERTEGQVDPGCFLFVAVLRDLVGGRRDLRGGDAPS